MRIVHTFGRNAGAVVDIAKEAVRFGRAPDNDVVFDPEYDRDASGHHAEARFVAGEWVLGDLGSRNGLFVNGERSSRRSLRDGDEITFGAKGPRVRVELGAAAGRGAAMVAPRASGTALESPLPGALVAAPPPSPAGAAQPAPAPVRAAPEVTPEPPRRPAKTDPDLSAPPAPPPPAAAPAAAPAAFAGQPAGRLAMGAPAPPAGARVGQRTMAMMISSAVAVATGRSKPMRTIEIHAMVDERVGAATAGQKRQLWVLGVLLVLALGGAAGLLLWGRASSDDIDKLRAQLASLAPDDPRRKDIEGKLGTLHPPNASFGRNLYDKSRKGIFMLAAGGEGFCTAFAVRPSVLATNAHCILAAQKHGGSIVALENEGHGQTSFTVSDMKPHPAYRDKDEQHLTPDVGVVTISGKAATVLELAGGAELQQTGAGDEVYLIGFPGRLMDAQNPAATFMGASVGRVTNASGRPGAFADAWLIQHNAQTTHGTSGSPVFNAKGHVIAINAGGYLEGDDEKIAGKTTEVVKDSPYKFGMRIDLLDAVLR